jgi:uncharacterized membrane protein
VGTGYNVLVFFHLVCVIGGFGALGYNGLYLNLARRKGPAAPAVLDINRQVSGLGELLVYGVFIFGIAAVGASHSVYKFSQAWVSSALALYVVDIGILHGVIRPAQRQREEAIADLQKAPASAGARPPGVARLDALDRRISIGWGSFNLVVIAVIYLMTFKPGK